VSSRYCKTDNQQPHVQYTSVPSEPIYNATDVGPTSWYPSGQEETSRSEGSAHSPDVRLLEPNFQTLELKNNGSNDAVERRRQQNRNSQMAYRNRTKKLIEDLRQEVSEYSEYSQDIYETLQSLRETTKALVSTIDHALSLQPPIGYGYLERPRMDSVEGRWSRRSSDDTGLGLRENGGQDR
jgi:hypothetical protein